MYYLLGTILIVAGSVLALMATVSYILTIRGNRAALTYGRVGVYGSFAMTLTLWVMLVGLFMARRYDVEYVYKYSSNELNTFFTIAATWAGQPGSFAIWAVFGSLASILLIGKTRHFEPYVLTIVMLFQALLIGLMVVSNPFKPLIDEQTGLVVTSIPQDGQGLNSLLYNFWMILHPPVLFVGYALSVVPFGFALAGLLRYDYDGWVIKALPWTLAAWAFLGLALFLGAYWAYETLGWGGYWGWDPVENSSLVPWLMMTAMLHSMLVQRVRGGLRKTNIALTIAMFVLVFYATFLTRSGVLSNFSVHSFIAEGLRETMIVALLAILVPSLVLFAMRWRDIPIRPLNPNFFSRDSFMVLAVLTLVVISTIIIIGTSMPVISAIPGVGHSLQKTIGGVFKIDDGTALGGKPLEDGRFSLTSEFFSRTTPPLGLIMMVLLIIGPLTSWREVNQQRMIHQLRFPFIATVIGTIIAILLGVRDGWGTAFVVVSIFAIGTNVVAILRLVRLSWWHIGAQISHLGLCIMIIGVVGSSIYASPDERVLMSAGETTSIYGFDITFHEWRRTEGGRGELLLTVHRGNTSFEARPELYFDRTMQSTMRTPAIKSDIWQDLYISPVEYLQEDNPNKPVLQREQTEHIGPYQITFDGFDVDEHSFQKTGVAEVGAKLNVIYQGKQHLVTPKLSLAPDAKTAGDSSFKEIPTQLPGGHQITLKMFDPSRQMVLVEIDGLNLPTKPAKVVITVSTKPAVVLVWVGSLVGVFGGCIALVRRSREGSVFLVMNRNAEGVKAEI